MTTPTSCTLQALRTQGYHAAVVEHWNHFAGIRQDLFGWIDVLAVRADLQGILGVQTTTSSNTSARLHKAKGNRALMAWLEAGNRLVIHGWAKRKMKLQGRRWSKRYRWELLEIPLGLGVIDPLFIESA